MKHIVSLAFVCAALGAHALSPVAPPPPTAADMAALQPIITEIQAAPPQRAARSIQKYVIEGRSYFYVRAPCCDQYNKLYTADGAYLCAPDGGIHGGGTRQQQCPHIRLSEHQGWTIWQDPRRYPEDPPR